jgi:hypothetical protein
MILTACIFYPKFVYVTLGSLGVIGRAFTPVIAEDPYFAGCGAYLPVQNLIVFASCAHLKQPLDVS